MQHVLQNSIRLILLLTPFALLLGAKYSILNEFKNSRQNMSMSPIIFSSHLETLLISSGLLFV